MRFLDTVICFEEEASGKQTKCRSTATKCRDSEWSFLQSSERDCNWRDMADYSIPVKFIDHCSKSQYVDVEESLGNRQRDHIIFNPSVSHRASVV